MINSIPYDFEYDHAQYMSLGDVKIPMALELRAKAALEELEDVQREFNLFIESHESAVKEREDKFEDAMSHFEESKDDWVRSVDEHGNVEWIHISNLKMEIPEWMYELERGDEADLLSWGSV